MCINEKCAAIAIFEPVFYIYDVTTYLDMGSSAFIQAIPWFLPIFFFLSLDQSSQADSLQDELDHQKPKGVLGRNLMKTIIQK